MSLTRPLFIAACVSIAFTAPTYAVAQNQELMAENYQQADANSDGRLAYAEFVSFIDLNAEDGLGRAARVSAKGLHAKAFERIDVNADGLVTPDELRNIKK